jgi:hypothetical protein
MNRLRWEAVMSETRSEWLAIIGSPLIGLALLWLLRGFLPPGMTMAIALTSGMAWAYYRKMGRIDLVVAPVTIALAFAVAQLVPNGWRPLIALVFVVAALLAAAWLRQRLSRPTN